MRQHIHFYCLIRLFWLYLIWIYVYTMLVWVVQLNGVAIPLVCGLSLSLVFKSGIVFVQDVFHASRGVLNQIIFRI